MITVAALKDINQSRPRACRCGGPGTSSAQANGTSDEYELLRRLHGLGGRRDLPPDLNRMIGCVAVWETVFFPPDEWLRAPADWPATIVSGRAYDLDALAPERRGQPVVIQRRLGQASVRLAVLDSYRQRQCAIATEYSLPVLEAAHIRPWAAGGGHGIPNCLPLRRDLHRLFDLGHLTIRPDLILAVSSRLRDDYANGKVYSELDGRSIQLPSDPGAPPDPQLLAWHEAEVYRDR